LYDEQPTKGALGHLCPECVARSSSQAIAASSQALAASSHALVAATPKVMAAE